MKPLPCPFCGHEYRGKNFTRMGKADPFECPKCGAQGPFPAPASRPAGKPQSFYDEHTVKAWNRHSSARFRAVVIEGLKEETRYVEKRRKN